MLLGVGGLAARRLAGRRLLVAVASRRWPPTRQVGRRSRRSSSPRPWRRCSGVAAAYGPRQDPLEALIATAPYGRTRLILLRTVGVLVSVLPVTVLLGLALPGPPWLAAAWLGPALALVPVLLALAGFVGPRAAATVVSLVLGRRRARLDACASRRPGRSRPHSRASTSGWPWPPVPSSRSGPAPTGSRGWRCEHRLRAPSS